MKIQQAPDGASCCSSITQYYGFISLSPIVTSPSGPPRALWTFIITLRHWRGPGPPQWFNESSQWSHESYIGGIAMAPWWAPPTYYCPNMFDSEGPCSSPHHLPRSTAHVVPPQPCWVSLEYACDYPLGPQRAIYSAPLMGPLWH